MKVKIVHLFAMGLGISFSMAVAHDDSNIQGMKRQNSTCVALVENQNIAPEVKEALKAYYRQPSQALLSKSVGVVLGRINYYDAISFNEVLKLFSKSLPACRQMDLSSAIALTNSFYRERPIHYYTWAEKVAFLNSVKEQHPLGEFIWPEQVLRALGPDYNERIGIIEHPSPEFFQEYLVREASE